VPGFAPRQVAEQLRVATLEKIPIETIVNKVHELLHAKKVYVDKEGVITESPDPVAIDKGLQHWMRIQALAMDQAPEDGPQTSATDRLVDDGYVLAIMRVIYERNPLGFRAAVDQILPKGELE
jgi:hypothetical protein